MLLIGMLDSPFVRRVAISMAMLGMNFERGDWSVGRDFERIREYNPLVRVPTLVLEDGVVLMESAAILDYIDELAGPERALLPRTGLPRRESLRLMALAIGAAEKGRETVYEKVFRPADKRHQPWLDRVLGQMHGALGLLEQHVQQRGADRWTIEDRITQADITLGCALTFLAESVALLDMKQSYPALHGFAARCEALPEFTNTKTAWFAPTA